jgi:hypothetical protein
MKASSAVRAKTKRVEQHDVVLIDLETIDPPMRLDMPDLGPQEAVDPVAAVTRILAAHQAARGNSSNAALLMGMTYQGLRRAIRRFEVPRRCADGVVRRIRVTVDGRALSLDQAVQFMHAMPNRDTLAAEVRVHLNQAVADGVRLVDIARVADIDATRLTKFRSKTGTLNEHDLRELLVAVAQLREEPIQSRSGRRATAA